MTATGICNGNGLGRAYLIRADVRGTLPLASGSIHCVVTSPPYFGLRDYGDPRQIGLEKTPAEFVARMLEVFREIRRVLRDDGVVFLNLGDSYNAYNGNAGPSSGEHEGRRCSARPKLQRGHGLLFKGLKPKDLIGIPWRVAFALQDDGWYLRSDIIWAKRNPMRESIKDRPTKAHEYLFLLTKSERYFYDNEAERVPFADERMGNPGRYRWKQGAGGVAGGGPNSLHKGDGMVEGWNLDGSASGSNLLTWWDIPVNGYPGAHFATFPPALPARCIRLGTSEYGCCPECGAPYRRLLSKDRKATRPGTASKVAAARDKLPSEEPGRNRGPERFKTSTLGSLIGNRDPARHTTTTKTLGWEPTCGCNAGPVVPCRVLDPFSGSGTTAAVARELGRVGIGLEVNADYLDLARDRVRTLPITRDNPTLAGPPRVAPMPGQLGIEFDEVDGDAAEGESR